MDVEVVETGNGGDLVKTKKDLSVIRGWQNNPYLSMFGGNVEQSTPARRFPNEQRFDYWANELLLGDPSLQFNSITEKTLMEQPLTSAGRIRIEEAIKQDLLHMKKFADVLVQTQIVAVDKIIIGIRIRQPDILENKDFVYIWDAANQELTNNEVFDISTNSFIKTFDFTFDESFR